MIIVQELNRTYLPTEFCEKYSEDNDDHIYEDSKDDNDSDEDTEGDESNQDGHITKDNGFKD